MLKKVENHRAAVALHVAHDNFVHWHRTIPSSRAMAAGVNRHLWSMEQLVERTTAQPENLTAEPGPKDEQGNDTDEANVWGECHCLRRRSDRLFPLDVSH
jgi:hypothetical protein